MPVSFLRRPIGLVSMFLLAVSMPVTQAAAATSTGTITLDAGILYQTIDGYGTSLVDQTGAVPTNPLDLWHMAPAQRSAILNALFSQGQGAGLSIMRFELGAGFFYWGPGYTIEPARPGSPMAIPSYQWDHSADHQVYFAQQAQQRGVHTFYADAWSAPGFMKTNGDVANGGDLCGESPCQTGDWRQAYASYLARYLKDYADDGINVAYVDPMNEPEAAPSYQSMTFTPAQATDFVKVLGATLARSGLPARVACCDNVSFGDAVSFQNALLADGTAAGYEAIATGHGYGGNVAAIPAAWRRGVRTWQTENSCIGDSWNTAYSTGDCDGQYWSDLLYNAMSSGVSAYFSWTGDWDHTDNEDLVRNVNRTTYQISSRLWAMANYARYVRPGAVRIGAQSSDKNMLTTAYRNTDGSYVLVIDNHNTDTRTASIAGAAGGTATPYVTNDVGGMQQQAPITIGRSGFSYAVPPNSTVTLRLRGATVAKGSGLGGTYQLVNVNSGLDLSVPGSSLTGGTHTDQESYAGMAAQEWTLSSLGEGQYKVVNDNSGLALTVDNSSVSAGAHINQSAWQNLPAQKWTLNSFAGGQYEIVNDNSGLTLGIDDSSTTPGALANQWTFLNAPPQKWILSLPASAPARYGHHHWHNLAAAESAKRSPNTYGN